MAQNLQFSPSAKKEGRQGPKTDWPTYRGRGWWSGISLGRLSMPALQREALRPRVPSPVSSLNDPTESILRSSRVGWGEVRRQIDLQPEMAAELEGLVGPVDLASKYREICVLAGEKHHAHMLESEGSISEGAGLRGPFRSHITDVTHYYTLPARSGETLSLCFKGDYLPPPPARFESLLFDHGLIPGGITLASALHEFDGALVLNELARQAGEKRLLTALPLKVVELKNVADGRGHGLALADFLDSPLYCPAAWAELRPSEKLSRFMLDSKNLVPGQYVYLIAGNAMRVSELFELMLFQKQPEAKPGQPEPKPAGTILRAKGLSSATIIKRAYNLLAAEYGYDVSAPQLNEKDGPEVQRQAARDSLESALRDIILDTFLDRITFCAALAHVNRCTFTSPAFGAPGSLTARNVTLNGTVLDLRCLSPNRALERDAFGMDLNDLLVSVAFMRRLLFAVPPKKLFDKVQSTYLEHVNQLGPEGKVYAVLEEASSRRSLRRWGVCDWL